MCVGGVAMRGREGGRQCGESAGFQVAQLMSKLVCSVGSVCVSAWTTDSRNDEAMDLFPGLGTHCRARARQPQLLLPLQ